MAGKRGNGEGTIGKRKDGRWEAKITIGNDPVTGKPVRVTYYGKTRKEVQEKVDAARTGIQQGTFAEPSKATFGEWLIRWMDAYKKPNLRPSTYGNNLHLINTQIMPQLGNVKLQSLRADMLQDFFNQKAVDGRRDGKGGLSSSMVKLIHCIILGSLKQAVTNKLLTFNPAEAVALPKIQHKEMATLDRNQVKVYLDNAKNHKFGTAFLLELSTGMRRGELLALRWQDIDFDEKTLSVNQTLYRIRLENGGSVLQFGEPKTAKSKRIIPLMLSVVKELKAYRARQAENRLMLNRAYQNKDLVFAIADGGPIDPVNLNSAHKQILKKAGLPHLRLHDLSYPNLNKIQTF